MDVEFPLRDLHRILAAVENPPPLTPLPVGLLFPVEPTVIVPAWTDDAELWFVGDIHGDLLALEAALHHIGRSGAIVFLGDLFDDGPHGAEVVSRIAQLDPDRYCLLAGNHDEGLQFDGKSFSSLVQPSEFAAWLNQHRQARAFGEALIATVRQTPRALFLPDGLLVTHGGFPLRDRWDAITTLADLNTAECLQDFVWTRASETARTKIPNRASKGCQFGYDDFSEFCELATGILSRPVQRMVRGHDHVEDRWMVYPRYVANPVLTINTLGHRLQREVFGPYERTACVARWVPGELPEVHRLRLPAEVIQRVYPEPVEATT